MRDWKRLVQERLAGLKLPAGVKEDVVAELAAHLEDSAAADSEVSESPDCTLAQIQWRKLGRAIESTKCEEGAMNHRTKTVWLPAIAILFAAGLTLMFLDRAAFLQRLIWMGCMAMLLCAARSEANRLSQRTKSILLPGFVSLTSASLFMLAGEVVLLRDPSFYFTDMSLRPDHWVSGAVFRFYAGWLLTQAVSGAAGAFLSRRAAGSPRARVLAAAFPAVVMFALWVVVIPVSALVEHNTFLWNHPLYYLLGVFVWVVPPAIALVAGAAPFLFDNRWAVVDGQ